MIKDILKGAVIGIANVIPGVSGGTMAVSMGIYDKMIHAVTHLFSEFKQSIKTLLPIGVGVALAIVAVARIIEYMFAVIPFQTNLLFIGLIIGGLPSIAKKVKGNSIKPGYMIAFLLFFGIVVGCAALDGSSGTEVVLGVSAIQMLKLFGVGVIASGTMVIPGVSGSMVLMVMGYYTPILNRINQFIDHLTSFDIPAMFQDCLILVPFGIGVVIGIFIIAKIIEVIFAKCPIPAYWAIMGLIVASPVAILMLNHFDTLNLLTIVTGIGTLALGTVVAMKLGEE